MRKLTVPTTIATVLGAVLAFGMAVAQGSVTQDVLNPAVPIGTHGVYEAGGATISRDGGGIDVRLQMPTPESGSYTYAAGTEAGTTEVFTLWVAVFNYPSGCVGLCSVSDLGEASPVRGGLYGLGGVVARSATLTFSGRIDVGQAAYSHVPLEAPLTADVHVIVAPHGAYDPSDAEQLTSPIGSPNCGCWWIAVFEDGREPADAESGLAALPASGSGGLMGEHHGAKPVAWAGLAAAVTLAASTGVRLMLHRKRRRL